MTTILQIVAHQDDDLLFMSPNLLHALDRGDQVHTLYLTAGDDGQGEAYWLARQQGSMAAYAEMLGQPGLPWILSKVSYPGFGCDRYSPQGDVGCSLTFAHLPDGNVDGSGFPATGNQSLKKLIDGTIPSVTDIAMGQTITGPQLLGVIAAFVNLLDGDVVLLQDWVHYSTPGWSDHADHMAGAFAAVWAIAGRGLHCVVLGFEGYQLTSGPANVAGADLQRKSDVFATYCEHDNRANLQPPYDAWLARQETVGVILL